MSPLPSEECGDQESGTLLLPTDLGTRIRDAWGKERREGAKVHFLKVLPLVLLTAPPHNAGVLLILTLHN